MPGESPTKQTKNEFQEETMKRFWTVLLSLGLIAAFAMPAAAAEFQLGGTWYMQGFYMDNYSLLDKNTNYGAQGTGGDPSWNNAGGPNGGSAAYANTARTNNRGAASMYTHKLTLRPMVQIVEGLSFHMQLDALEGVMSDVTNLPGGQANMRTSVATSSRPATANTGVLAQENIEFEQAFVKFKTGLGQFTAGYQYTQGDFFGTQFLQQPFTRTAITWKNEFGPLTVMADVVKLREYRNRSFYGGASTATAATNNIAASNGVTNDADGDVYGIYGIFKFKAGEAGLGYEYWRDSMTKNNPALAFAAAPSVATWGPTPTSASNGYTTGLSTINPYTKLRFGPVYIEAEGFYRFGNLKKYEGFTAGQTVVPDVTLSAYGIYALAQVDFKPFFAGAKFIYKSGDDMNSADKSTGSTAYMYADDYGSPVAGTLLLYNADYADPMGFNYGNAVRFPVTRYIDNVWFYQAFIGVNPTAKLNITARLSYANADKKPRSAYGTVGSTTDAFGKAITANVNGDKNGQIVEYVSDKIGYEVDLIANYKIFDNLTYTVGGGYLFVGDYFKGFDSDAKIKDNYLLMHKLTLMF